MVYPQVMVAPRVIQYMLFDLGGTLMYARNEWGPILHVADRALVDSLRSQNIQLDPLAFRARLYEYYDQRDKDLMETTYHFVLRELLSELGYAEVDESIIRSALDALFSATQPNWLLEHGAQETIRELKSSGFHLGILSNAGDDQDVQQLIQRFGIRDHFDFVLTSAACFYRKPHPRAFELALAQWNVAPVETMMIGDNLYADIQGAQSLGMKTIWIKRHAQYAAEDLRRIRPDLSLSAFSELLSALTPFLQKIS